jgi:amino acid transporter
MSVPAIFFAYDGFYIASSLHEDLKKPKSLPKVFMYGLLAISIVYVSISVSLMLYSAEGSFDNKAGFLPKEFFTIMKILITIGVLGGINAFAHYSTKFYGNLIKNNELILGEKIRKLTSGKSTNPLFEG